MASPCRCTGVTTRVGTHLLPVSPPGECQLLTSCDAGDDSDEEDNILRGAEAERYSRVSSASGAATASLPVPGLPWVMVAVVVAFCATFKTGSLPLF